MTDSPLAVYAEPLRRWWWAVAGLVLLAFAVTWFTLPEQRSPTAAELAAEGESFRATHLLIRNQAAQSPMPYELIDLLARQGDLTRRVTERAEGRYTATAVEEVVLVTDPVTDTISITATRRDPEEAAELATLFAAELVEFLDERTLNTVENDFQRVSQRLEDLQASIDDLESQIALLAEGDTERLLLEADLASLLEEYGSLRTQQRSLEEQRAGLTEGFTTLETPVPVPVQEEGELLTLPRRPGLRFGLAGLLALALGAAAVLGYDRLDTRVRTRRQAEEAFGLPVLSELPRRRRSQVQRHPLPAFNDPGGVTAEVLRALRLSISLAPTWHLTSLSHNGTGAVGSKTPVKLEHEPRSVVVTSALTGDGKSTLVANLAVSVAEGGRRVLVVDCDFRRPAVGRLLEVDGGLGLRELAQVGERPLRDLASPTVAPNVAMVRSGSRGVTPPWFMREAKELVELCLEMADYVIFDTGPITLTNEASALLPHVDTALMVVRSGKVATDQARGAVEQLTQVDAHVSGVVLVGSNSRRRYGYGYYREAGPDPAALEIEAAASTGPPSAERGVPSLWHTNRRPDDPETPEDATPGGESLADPSRSPGGGPSGIQPSGKRASP
jgi:capsular exopolysaccharide synthesis family protein